MAVWMKGRQLVLYADKIKGTGSSGRRNSDSLFIKSHWLLTFPSAYPTADRRLELS